MLSHELRNPLSAIKTAITVLDRAGDRAEVADRARQSVHRQVRHLTEIVDELLDVARLNSGKITLNSRPLDLARVARHVVNVLRDAGRCAHLAIATDLSPVTVLADETRLEQVISNLLDNACKYTPAGGRVEIVVRAEGDQAILTVRDSGVGIAPGLLPYVFDIFAQGSSTPERANGGLGLGLTVVRRLVELHGGHVAALSDGVDRGAMFVIRLPRVTTAPASAATATPGGRLEPMRIAIVEDGADNREVMAALLRMEGHQVTVAADGPSGLAAILAGPVDVALVDVGLPGFDGMELARRVRATAAGKHVQLIALTGYGSEQDRAAALAAGFDTFLVKPFDFGKFEAVVREARVADVR
jgi:two-component system, sensor histidine kinase